MSKMVRAVMRIHGKTMIFNNIYYTGTRTVKCYQGTPREVINLEFAIRKVLDTIAVKYEIKCTPARQYGSSGFIVKLK